MNKAFLTRSILFLSFTFTSLTHAYDQAFLDRTLIPDSAVIEFVIDDIIYKGTRVDSSSLVAKATFSIIGAHEGEWETFGALCTATLIGKNLLLTAAHCFKTHEARAITYYSPSSDSYEVIRISQVQKHENFYMYKAPQSDIFVEHDIALIRIEKSIPDAVPALLPKSNFEISKGQKFIVAGYGENALPEVKLAENSKFQAFKTKLIQDPKLTVKQKKEILTRRVDKLLASPLLIVEAPMRILLRADNVNGPTLYRDVGRSTCKGDSGGPNFLRTRNGRLVLVGIHSSGNNAECTPDYFDQFHSWATYVPNYIDWIRKTASKMNAQIDI